MGEQELILQVVKVIKSFVFDAIIDYVGYIGNCQGNLDALRTNLKEVCNKNDDIKQRVKVAKDKQKEITREAADWLHDVRALLECEELKELMYKDIQTAKYLVKRMGKEDLKRRISEESEMQEVVVKVMKKLKEDMKLSKEEEIGKLREADYKHVAEVVIEVMKDTIDEFKRLMKEDREMAIIAMRTLKVKDLDNLTKDDEEMKEIVREARNANDKEQWPNHVPNNVDGEETDDVQPSQGKIPAASGSNKSIKEVGRQLFTPLANLVTPLEKLMGDGKFKSALSEDEGVKLALEVIDGLWIKGRGLQTEMDDNAKQQRGCCSSLSLCNYHGRYLISKAARLMADRIKEELINKCPQGDVTVDIRTADLPEVPTRFLKGLDSRNHLLDQILEKLNKDQVNAVGLFGMGGTGKTTLAKEVIKSVTDTYAIKVMVEVSDSPDFVRIQAAIAESIDLPLHDIDNVAQRAKRLYNRLILEKEKKILIILDNVWKKLNLDEIGIPDTCKLLLTTRDREVCRAMDVREGNIVEVDVMKINEARELFKSQAGKQANVGEYKSVVERLLSKCGGLPLAIVATANSLKDKNLYSWVKFADDLEKPISSQRSGGDYHDTFVILNTSYKFIQPDEKRIFFLLACLSPLGSSVSIESLMRYGMGLNLFEYVNKLSEAIEQAVTWANELKLASMLLEGDVKGDVKIHDVVRDFAISYAAKEEEHRFMVEAVPRWMDDETLKNYTAMSLTSKNDYSRLSGVEVCKLQILILKGDLSPEFDDDVFSGMVNLKVLAVSNMDFHPSLPESMRKLKKLRTLCMEGCKLGNIELVGELVNLLILSLRESSLENLPNEIGNLSKLRLLDLNGCTSSNKLPLIPAHILNKLSRLEGLYMYSDKQRLFETKSDYENYRLPYLNAFEMKLRVTEGLPIDEQFVGSLDKFKICFGDRLISADDCQKFSGILAYQSLYDRSGSIITLKDKFPNILLKKTDYLEMRYSNEFEDLVPQFDQEGFRSLRFLDLRACNDMKCIADGRTMSNLIAFPCLENITLKYMESLEMVCHGDVSPQTFAKLQHLNISSSDKLLCGLPLVPRNLKTIDLSYCELLKFVFIEDEDVPPIELPFLEILALRFLPCLLSLVGPKKCNTTSHALQTPQFFFDGKIVLPSLQRFTLHGCRNVVKLWSKEISASEFQNLRDITIYGCEKLSSVGSTYVFSNLVQLETLSINECKEIREVISFEETQESETVEQVIRFPWLTCLNLENLSKLQCFYGGESELEFPKLKILILDELGNMKRFAKLENSSALFHKKINFPCLEELQVTRMDEEVMGLWDKQSSSITNPVPKLTKLALGSSSGLQQLLPVILGNLGFVTLAHFHDDDSVFMSSNNSGEEEGLVSIYSQLPNLENLKVEDSRSLKELFRKEDLNAVDDTLTAFCGQFKSLDLKNLPSLNLIPVHLFKSITSLTLWGLTWDYLISAHVLEDSLQQLQFLSIQYCKNMEALVINVGSQINFPSLKQLRLEGLASLIGISATPKKEVTLLLPLLESLEINSCDNLEHFWSSTILAPKLQELKVICNDILKQVFVGSNPEEPIELPSLQMVYIASCRFMESITSASLIAPKLREVTISACGMMRCFFPTDQNDNGDLQLLSLMSVTIETCRSLDAFSQRRVVAPQLTEIKYNDKCYSMLPFDDINHFLQKMNPS